MTAKISDKTRALVVRLLRKPDMPTEAIAKQAGISVVKVRRIAKEEELERPIGRPRGVTLPEAESKAAQAVRLHHQGMSPDKIAARIDRSLRSVYHYLQKAGVPLGENRGTPGPVRRSPKRR